MISTKYNDKITHQHDNILKDAIKHEIKTGSYEHTEPIRHKISLSEAIDALPTPRTLTPQPNVGQNILKPKQKRGAGKAAVVYKKQTPVIGGNNVDFK